MSRHKFLGTTDLGTVKSLLNTYDVPTKIPDCVKLHQVKQQDDLFLIELGTLLTSDECDQIVQNLSVEQFEQMSHKYDQQTRNSSRLVVIDDRLGRTLWRRLKFSHKLSKLVSHTQPLGFNVQGQWELCGINPAMRINKYKQNDFFAPHKDAQYAPSGDRRSLLSLIIYLNDDYRQGQTRFYFPKQSPTSDIKGLTIKEEIEAFGGLENGYEYITFEPKKGYAVLFSHNLLHEAMPPETNNANHERFVLRTDVLVERTSKPLGFAICAEEKQDYLACLNFFREAQQCELKANDKSQPKMIIGDLYERALSIRYCYPRLLERKLQQSMDTQDQLKSLVDRLPSEPWLHIFKYLSEQYIDNLIYAYPDFQMLKIVWQGQENTKFSADKSKEKFLPTIVSQYGSRTLFCFNDRQFFSEHVEQCCRVAAVYAFFLLGHSKDARTYTVRYNRDTQEVCEVEMEKLLYDVFYNRNCYGSLYRIKQKNKNKREVDADFNASVDRAYMINRYGSQFLGQDLLSRFHVKINIYSTPSYYSDKLSEENLRSYLRTNCLLDGKRKLIEIDEDEDDYEYEFFEECSKDDKLGYCQQLLKQIEETYGTSICRMISSNNHIFKDICLCGIGTEFSMKSFQDLIKVYNHLIFDFDTHQLKVEHLSNEDLQHSESIDVLHRLTQKLKCLESVDDPIEYYRVNVGKLAEKLNGFNHASCQCSFPNVTTEQFSFLDYTHLSHVDLAVVRSKDQVYVLTTYGGIAAF